MSEELKSYFSSAETLRHSGKKNLFLIFILFLFLGGHFVPATGEEKKVFVNYLQKMQNEFV